MQPARSNGSNVSEYEQQRAKNIAENQALLKQVFGDSVWGNDGPPTAKGKEKGSKQSKT